MTISFRYKTIKRPDGSEVKTPAIPIVLDCEEKFETIALLDSGADMSAMPSSIAEIIGLKLSGEKKPAYGLGGRLDSVQETITVTVGKGHEHYTFNIPVKVILDHYDFPVLLGRLGFFDKFIISFDQSQEKVSLKKINRR